MKTNSLGSLRATLCATAFAVWFPGCLPDGTSPELPLSEAGSGGGSGSAAGSGASGNSAGNTAGRGTTSGAGASGMAGSAGRAMMPAVGGSGGARAGAAGRSGAGGASGTAGMMATAGRSGAGAGGMAGAGMGGMAGAGRGGMGGAGMGGMAGAGMGGMGGAGMGGMAGAAGGGAATFTQVYALIMTGCGCHVSGSSGGLSMANKMTAYTNLVGVDSTACSGQKRVVANDPANSVLFHSVDRTMLGSCRVPQMPAGGAAKLAQADIDRIRAWIMAGAMNN